MQFDRMWVEHIIAFIIVAVLKEISKILGPFVNFLKDCAIRSTSFCFLCRLLSLLLYEWTGFMKVTRRFVIQKGLMGNLIWGFVVWVRSGLKPLTSWVEVSHPISYSILLTYTSDCKTGLLEKNGMEQNNSLSSRIAECVFPGAHSQWYMLSAAFPWSSRFQSMKLANWRQLTAHLAISYSAFRVRSCISKTVLSASINFWHRVTMSSGALTAQRSNSCSVSSSSNGTSKWMSILRASSIEIISDWNWSQWMVNPLDDHWLAWIRLNSLWINCFTNACIKRQ